MSLGWFLKKNIVKTDLENNTIETLSNIGIQCYLAGEKYTYNEEPYNWYKIGINEDTIFGELDFSPNLPIWRVNWWIDGRYHRDTGKLDENFNGLLETILKLSIPGIRNKEIQEKMDAINDMF